MSQNNTIRTFYLFQICYPFPLRHVTYGNTRYCDTILLTIIRCCRNVFNIIILI